MTAVRLCFDWLKRHWGRLKWPIALALLAYLFYQYRGEFGRFQERQVQWGFAALALGLCAAGVVSTFLRWYLLVWGQEFAFSVRDALRLGFLGYLFNYVAPGAVGGDLVKAVMLARRQQERRMIAVSTVLLDRLLGLLGLFIIAGLVGLLPTPLMSDRPELRGVVGTFQVLSIAGLVGLAVALHPAIPRSRWLQRLVTLRYVGRVLGELLNAVLLYQVRRRVLFVAVAISLLGHVLMLSAFYCAARAVHPAESIPGYWSHLQFVPAAQLAGVIVPLPGGTGALEAALAYLYEVAGAQPADGFLTGVGYRVISILIAAVGAGYYFISRQEIDQALEDELHPDTTEKPAGAVHASLIPTVPE